MRVLEDYAEPVGDQFSLGLNGRGVVEAAARRTREWFHAYGVHTADDLVTFVGTLQVPLQRWAQTHPVFGTTTIEPRHFQVLAGGYLQNCIQE